jgi:hypothetical protein
VNSKSLGLEQGALSKKRNCEMNFFVLPLSKGGTVLAFSVSHFLTKEDDMASRDPLRGYFKILQRIKDATIAVAHNYRTGLYIWGRHGTGKTWTARTTLEEEDPDSIYLSGHVDPEDFFQTLKEYPDGHILLDDTSSLFSTKTGKQLAAAALGKQGKSNVRLVKRKGKKVLFSGGVIIISNLDPRTDAVMKAVLDRCKVIQVNPSDDTIAAFIRHLADQGHERIAPEHCREIADWYLSCCTKYDVRPSLRGYADNATAEFRLAASGLVRTDWHNSVEDEVAQQAGKGKHPELKVLSRAQRSERDLRTALEIYRTFPDRTHRIQQWKQRAKRSQPAFYRRITELRQVGILPPE